MLIQRDFKEIPYKDLGFHPMGSNRVIRGGGWNSNARNCRSANRNGNSPGNRNNNVGFRLVSPLRTAKIKCHCPG
ncbi:MAG: SUMF1/EgtB/PvdO family nonheme iron enzyme [Candidatus Magnetomorum sp.]|nr:SUMF1/EgtB/PvdO family nonheme iron enzyme [Candidatus Magnetomorum sp.]